MNNKNPLDDILAKVPSTTMHVDRERERPNKIWLLEYRPKVSGGEWNVDLSGGAWYGSCGYAKRSARNETKRSQIYEYRAMAYIREESTNAKS